MHDEQGAPLYLISQILDIGRRKAAAEELRASEALLEEAQAIARLGSWEWDVLTGAVTWSDALYAVFGLDPSSFEPSFERFLEHVHPEDRAIAEHHAVEAARHATPFDYEHRIVRPDGEVRYVNSRGTASTDEHGHVTRLTGTAQDVTDLHLATLQLEQANAELTRSVDGLQARNRQFALLRELSELLQHAPDVDEVAEVVATICDRLLPTDTGVLYLRGSGGDLVTPIAHWGGPASEAMELALDDCWSIRRGRLHAVDDATGIRCRHASRTQGAYVCAPMLAHGEAQGFLHVQRTSGDGSSIGGIAELVAAVAENVALALTNLQLREELRAQATRDPLTGLFNRRFMMETFERELVKATRDGGPVSVVMMDLDRFKAVNDDFGHEVGDAVLKEVAAVLVAQVRGSDVVCRHGGEEFVLVLPGASLERAAARAGSILQGLRNLSVDTRNGSRIARITASFGVAAAPDNGWSSDGLLREADRALYRAKSLGRDRVECAEPATTMSVA